MRFGKFNLVGLIGTALQLLLTTALTNFCGLSAVQATPIAVELTLLHNFLWHERFTWRDRFTGDCQRSDRFGRLWRFHAGNGLVSICGNTLLVFAFQDFWKLPMIPSLLAAIGICSLINFLLADRWVFTPLASKSLI